jgi:hypothetical protein
MWLSTSSPFNKARGSYCNVASCLPRGLTINWSTWRSTSGTGERDPSVAVGLCAGDPH